MYRTLLVGHFLLSGHWCFFLYNPVLYSYNIIFRRLIISFLCVLIIFFMFRHAAAAYFNLFLFDKICKICGGEESAYWLIVGISDLCRNISAVWGIEADYFSFALFGFFVFVVHRFLVMLIGGHIAIFLELLDKFVIL